VNRLAALFERRRAKQRAALIGYFTVGDPGPEESLAILFAAAAAGIDALELGFPFSDPVLDGTAIQRAHRRALAAGASLAGTLTMVERFRSRVSDLPIVLMGYYNPVFAYGPQRFARAAAAAGVDAVILADLPIHEAAEELLPALADNGLGMIPLYAPNLEPPDYAVSAPGVGGFLYCIPVLGPSGGPPVPIATIAREVARCRMHTRLPVGVGFGIRNPESAAAVARIADGVIVGSALVDHMERWVAAGARSRTALCEGVSTFISQLCAAVGEARPADFEASAGHAPRT